MTLDADEARIRFRSLTRELQCHALVGFSALLWGFFAISSVEGWRPGAGWLLSGVFIWGVMCRLAWLRRELNRPAAESLAYPDLGLANRLTLLRGLLIAATGGFLLLPFPGGILPWAPAALYSMAATLDRLDGHFARASKRISLLGSELDTEFDALGLLIAPLLAVVLGKLHWSYLLVSVAYYLFVAGIRRRQRHGLPVFPLSPSRLRRSLAGFQMGFVAVVLWPPFAAQFTVLAGSAFMLPVLAGFAFDWLAVSGRIDPRETHTAAQLARLRVFSETRVQPFLRLVGAVTLMLPGPVPGTLPGTGLWLAALLLLLGLGGRLAALVILLLLAWRFPEGLPGMAGVLAMFALTGTLLLGGGRYSLWQGDDQWVNRGDST